MSPVLIALLGFVLTLGLVVTTWSVAADLKIYRTWKREIAEEQPRWKRRQQNADEIEQDRKRWRWLLLALQLSAFGFIAGGGGVAAGYFARVSWMMVAGANLVFLGLMAWVAYNLLIPKPTALRQKRLPSWLKKPES